MITTISQVDVDGNIHDFQACVASLFSLDPSQVPNFYNGVGKGTRRADIYQLAREWVWEKYEMNLICVPYVKSAKIDTMMLVIIKHQNKLVTLVGRTTAKQNIICVHCPLTPLKKYYEGRVLPQSLVQNICLFTA